MLRRRRSFRAVRWMFGTATTLAVLAVLTGVVLMVRLSEGPIRVDAIGSRIAAALEARTGDRYAFDLGATFVARGEFGPTLVIDDFRVRSGDATIVQAPRAEVSIDPLSLLAGDVRPRRLLVSNIDINLVVLPDGSVSVAGGEKATPISVTPAPPSQPVSETDRRAPRAALLAQAGEALRKFFDFATGPSGAIGAIERIGIKSGRLIVDDRTADRHTAFEALDLEFVKGGLATDLLVTAQGPNGPISLEAHANGAQGQLRTLDMVIKDISFDEIVLAGGIRRPNFDSDVKLAASARFALDPEGKVREAAGTFAVGSGYVRLEDPDHEPYFVDEISGSLRWDPAARRIVVDPTHLFAADTRVTMTGSIIPPKPGEEGWRLALGLAEPGALSPERPGERILVVNELPIEGIVLPFAQRMTLTRAAMKGPEIDVALTGVGDWTQGLRVKFTGQAGQGPFRSLLRVWPSHVGSSVRSWLINHTQGGQVRGGTISAEYDQNALLLMRFGRPPPDEALTMDFTLVNGAVETLAGLPSVTNLDATVHLTGHTMLMTARGGTLEMSNNRRLTLLEGTLDMPRNDGADAVPAHLSFRASGPLEAAAEVMSREAMKAVAQMPVEAGSLHGRIEGRVAVDFEIGPAAQASRTIVETDVTASDVSVDRLVGKERLEGASIRVASDGAGFKASGTGRIFGGPTTFEIRRQSGQPANVVATLMLDEAARARNGYALTGVTGPISARVSATVGSEVTKAQFDLDLTRTGIENGIPGLVKPAGKPARLAFTLDQRSSSVLLDQLVFESAGASAKGVVELTSEGAFQSARFSQMRLSAGDEFKADISKNSDAGVKIAVRAANFDARPFLKLLTQPGTSAPGVGGDFDLELKAPVVTGFGKQALSNVDLRLVRKASAIRQFTMNAAFGRRPVAAAMSRSESGTPLVNIATPDAGALMAFTDLYQRMEGGALAAVMQVEAGRVTGTVKVANFVLKDEPALRRLVIDAVPQQPAAQAGKPQPKLDANQIQFDRLQVVFTHANGRLDIRDGLMNGQALGLTVEGSIDDTRDALNLTGTYVPAYGINNLFAKIPVVGLFLGGGWNEGLFAVNYHITGRPSSPVLNINPLSAVAPGFLRKVFGAIDGTGQAPQEQSWPPPSAPAPATRGLSRTRPVGPAPSAADPSTGGSQ